jgi:histidyl-tRNA synthetase
VVVVSRISPLSGFPEWLPPQRMIELTVLDRLRTTFELYGFAPLDTRAVEPLDQLLRKGETSKEVYLLRRLQASDPSDAGEELGLHFDLTVPFARFVLENAGKLVFPFRRYQIQKVWRGERPQEGRYREFLQADIDVVDRDTLPFHYDVEIPLIIGDALGGLPIPPVRVQVNNRKLCEGFYRGIGIEDPATALQAIDKLDKIGPAAVCALLVETAGASEAQAKACLALADISAEDASFADAVRALGVRNDLLDEGLEELVRVVEAGREHQPGLLVAELKIARGLDYYTGTVYETQMLGYERLGSICSGGRYDNLASTGDVRYPGVGISVGVSRMLGILFGASALAVSRPVPTCVLVAVTSEGARATSDHVAAALRRRGIPTEVSPSAAKFGKQIRYAERRGIPYVWFPSSEGSSAAVGAAPAGAAPAGAASAGGSEVKDIRTGDQVPADPATWFPPPADLHPVVSSSS